MTYQVVEHYSHNNFLHSKYAYKHGAEGANINFNEDGSLMFIMDSGWIEQTLHAVAKATGQKMPRYIKPNANNDFSEKASNNPTV
ncbi:hypothetical protein [Psychrobacter sp. P2G3]|uniref:hypothetical protein n=1 Tax=Psychrobacter sp. P2G3 TaxID=1699622 RepID=UPI00078E9B6E|nr:hypothetical protein [Psychrobacter sp. P2G3]AMN49246.1 hypothetical protein AK823_04620 [Psychrobacter sp. P2G3]